MKIKEIDNNIKKVFPHFNIGREKNLTNYMLMKLEKFGGLLIQLVS